MARMFKVTLKDQENAPRSYEHKGYKFTRGRSLEISNVADADYFDANPEFQVSEIVAPTAAAAPAAPKGRFAKAQPKAAAPAESGDDEGEEEEIEVSGGEEEDEIEDADEAPELEQALTKKPAKGKAAKKGQG